MATNTNPDGMNYHKGIATGRIKSVSSAPSFMGGMDAPMDFGPPPAKGPVVKAKAKGAAPKVGRKAAFEKSGLDDDNGVKEGSKADLKRDAKEMKGAAKKKGK